MQNAFITGSHAYGTPREDSDVDVVVLMSFTEMEKLELLLGLGEDVVPVGGSASSVSTSIRVGKLNLIIFSSEAAFNAWRQADAALRVMKPVTREQAVACIRSALEATYD